MARTTVRVLVISLALGLAGPAMAQDSVKVGNETKRASGTVVSLSAGDTACHLKLKDDRGTGFDEMADFEICEKKNLVGKRVALTYALRQVMSPDCQGNPDCKKSRTVALVTAATVAATPPTSNPGTTQPAKPRTTWCTPGEQVVFNCATNTRVISVCASRGATATSGTLQYRFGKPNGAEPEIEQPKDKPAPARAALGDTFPLSGGGGAWIRFKVGTLRTTVYTAIGKFGPKGETQERAGLVAEQQGKEIASLRCVGKATSELGPDWFKRLGILSGNEDFMMPD